MSRDLQRSSLVLGALALAAASWPARAQAAEPARESSADEEPDAGSAPKPLAVGAAFVPGVLLHGSGTWVEGDRESGETLLAMEGAGAGLIVAGGVPIALTGASRYIVAPAAALTIVGFGLFTVSWLADVFSVTTPDGGLGAPRLHTPWVQTELGVLSVEDPQFDYGHFVVQAVDLRSGRLRLAPRAAWSADTTNARVRVLGGIRLMGPLPSRSERRTDGSALDLELALTRHDYGSDGFVISTGEVFVRSRTDLVRWAPALEGSFLELGLGGAVQQFRYDLPGIAPEPDLETMLLARVGFGLYVGGPSAPDGEVLLYYDHRHDDFAGGLLSTLPTSGVLGHFGLEPRLFFSERWGVAGQAQVGAALVTGLSLLYREDVH